MQKNTRKKQQKNSENYLRLYGGRKSISTASRASRATLVHPLSARGLHAPPVSSQNGGTRATRLLRPLINLTQCQKIENQHQKCSESKNRKLKTPENVRFI